MKTELLAWLINATVATSLAALAVLLLRKPLQRWLGAEIAYRLWVVLPLAAFAACFSLPQPASEATLVAPVTFAAAPAVVVRVTSSLRTVDADRWLLAIWLLGACALLAILVWQQRRFVVRLGLRRGDDGSWRSGMSDAAPAVLGVLRQRLVLPERFESDYSNEEQQLVIAHERMHQLRRDPWALAICALLRTLFWFNPIVQFAAVRFRRDVEMACDAAVLRTHPGSRQRYATALLKTQIAEHFVPVGCLWHHTPPMKERIMLLKHALPMRRARLAGAIMVSVAVLGTAGFAMAGHDSAMTTASALAAAVPSSPARAGTFYKVRLKVEMRSPASGSGDARSQDTQRVEETVIVRSGETAMVKMDRHGHGPAWGMHFRVDPNVRTHDVAFHGDVFSGDEQHVIGRAQLAETTDTPMVIAMNDSASGTAYRIEAVVSATATPPVPPAPPAPPVPADFPPMPQAPSAPPALANVQPPPAPPAPPAPSAHVRSARNTTAPALAPPPPAPPVAPMPALAPPAPPVPPAPDGSTGQAPPHYPAAALAQHIGGEVPLKLLVAANGSVKHAEVVSSYPKGVFDQASLDATKQWHFTPARDAKGHPVSAYVLVPVTFDPRG